MTRDEQAVIEAAVDLQDIRRASLYGMVKADDLNKAEFALEMAVASLHAEHDGRWEPRDE